jgi:hypothetical protein
MLKEQAANANQATSTTGCLVIKQLVVIAHKGLAILKQSELLK